MPPSVYRKLVKIGNSVYVSIPRGWIESRGLGPGSIVAIELVEGGLLLKPAEKYSSEVKVKQVVGGSSRDVITAYLAGYEIIEIEKPSSELKGALEKLLDLLVGLEVVEEGRDKLVLQCFVGEGYEVRGVLSRMDVISRSMYIDAAAALENGDQEALEMVRGRDDKLDRLYFLAVRLIRSTVQLPDVSAQDRLFLIDARLFAKLLEEIGDEAERMTYMQPAGDLLEAARCISKYQKEAVEAFLGRGSKRLSTEELTRWILKRDEATAFSALAKISKMVLDLMELL